MLFVAVLFLMFVIIGGGIALLVLNKPSKMNREKGKEETVKFEQKEDIEGKVAHIEELSPVEFLADGIYFANGVYCALGKIEGTNFSVMSEHDQNTRESVFIDILTNIDYPIQFVTTSVVANTGRVAKEIAQKAVNMPEGNLKTYSALYANALDGMHKERRILSQCSWLVITDDGSDGDPVYKLKEKMNILASAMQQRAGVVFTPLQTTEEAIDVFGQILNSDSLIRPSEFTGGMQPIHLSEREVFEHAQLQESENAA